MRTGNLALRFVLELACLAALAYWGAGATASDAANVALAILAPLTAATVWGVWSAPRAPRRLSGPRLVPGVGVAQLLLRAPGRGRSADPRHHPFVLALTNAALLRRPETAAADR